MLGFVSIRLPPEHSTRFRRKRPVLRPSARGCWQWPASTPRRLVRAMPSANELGEETAPRGLSDLDQSRDQNRHSGPKPTLCAWGAIQAKAEAKADTLPLGVSEPQNIEQGMSHAQGKKQAVPAPETLQRGSSPGRRSPLSHCAIVALCHCRIVPLSHCRNVALWHCGIVAMSHCRIVALSHSRFPFHFAAASLSFAAVSLSFAAVSLSFAAVSYSAAANRIDGDGTCPPPLRPKTGRGGHTGVGYSAVRFLSQWGARSSLSSAAGLLTTAVKGPWLPASPPLASGHWGQSPGRQPSLHRS